MDGFRDAFERLLGEAIRNNDSRLTQDAHRFLEPSALRRASESEPRRFADQYDLPMLHTKESIMQDLGLDPDFSGVSGAPPGRLTGKTTRMLIDAAVALQYGRVCVAGYCESYTRDLNLGLERLCSRLGIDTSNLIRIHGQRNNIHIGLARLGYMLSEVQVFYDHYLGRDDVRTQSLSSRVTLDQLHALDFISSPTIFPTFDELLGVDQKCPMCKYYSGSKHLRCTPNPTGDALECPHFEMKQ